MVKNIGMIGDSIAHGYYDEKDLGWFARLGKIILSDHKAEYLFNNMSQSGDNIADDSHLCRHAYININLNGFFGNGLIVTGF